MYNRFSPVRDVVVFPIARLAALRTGFRRRRLQAGTGTLRDSSVPRSLPLARFYVPSCSSAAAFGLAVGVRPSVPLLTFLPPRTVRPFLLVLVPTRDFHFASPFCFHPGSPAVHPSLDKTPTKQILHFGPSLKAEKSEVIVNVQKCTNASGRCIAFSRLLVQRPGVCGPRSGIGRTAVLFCIDLFPNFTRHAAAVPLPRRSVFVPSVWLFLQIFLHLHLHLPSPLLFSARGGRRIRRSFQHSQISARV
ncbi:unnamed protein product [Soboliphyme baturini]|uniref:Transmembrane protein n=1 Tax=Soboliphyme baturini TaxID=241478 RepID=A0A183IA49_9BILA|nr:unnamed protein product [Soboliphyme baturini]